MACALAVLLGWQAKTTKTHGWFGGFEVLVRLFGVMILASAGGVFGMFGAAAAASASNKRFVIIVPALANFALLLWFVAGTLAP